KDPSPASSSASPRRSTKAPSSQETRSTEPETTSRTRGINTAGGYVSGTCRGRLATVSASPAVGWRIDGIDAGPDEEAKVKFRKSGDGEGEVEVRVRCSGGVPTF